MSNMIQAAREQVAALTQAAYERAAAEGLLPAGAEVKATIEIPKDVTHGVTLLLRHGRGQALRGPRQIAEVSSAIWICRAPFLTRWRSPAPAS